MDDRENVKQRWLDMMPSTEPVWIFGYGSLMWNPKFAFDAVEPAKIFGYHRRFCVYSHIYRGTPENPGLVFGLDRGGSCKGIAFRISASAAHKVLGAVWDREMIYGIYLARDVYAKINNGRVLCRTFVVNPNHQQYAAQMSNLQIAKIIIGANGEAGPNTAYLKNTLSHMQTLGFSDPSLWCIQHAVERLLSLE
jgi:cation transport protein ChaC|tara:strand:- start:1245 stop:1826 length:582 start_codon:yes stop_codon:yes gene_type:complete